MRQMRSKARRALGKYFIPEDDARHKDLNKKRRSFHNAKSFFEGLNQRRKNRSKANRLPKPVGSSIHGKQQSVYGGGKRKRRKTRRKSKRTKRRSRRTRR